MKTESIQIKTHQREELVDITSAVQSFVTKSGINEGIVFLHVPHTTAAVTINENADPDVTRDILYKLNKEIPQSDGYHHGEGNSDAHVKSSLVGPALSLIISGGRMLLGTWQGIYFCEFDGPRTRSLYLKAIEG
ncbi:MAG: secondary thiamine-phosphate synthase enzyme YjbQ [Candidatus Zixiibacteriota bacterium]